MGKIEGEEADGDSDESEEADEATSGGGCLSHRRRLFIAGVSSGGTDVTSIDWGVTGSLDCEQPCAGVTAVSCFCGETTPTPMGSADQASAYGSHFLSQSSCAMASSNHLSDLSMMLADVRGAPRK